MQPGQPGQKEAYSYVPSTSERKGQIGATLLHNTYGTS